MRPLHFSIPIPDRPAYQPGSGPEMAPITLQPDDSDTGWVIVGTVDFQKNSQYIVTPKENPAHRRPVKKQQILDWVSPKALEDFEYAQYIARLKAEQERRNSTLAKAAVVKERRRGMGLARERLREERPFTKYMQLEQVEDSDKGDMNEQLSSPEHSSDELSRDFLIERAASSKRKRSVERLQNKPLTKRRGLLGSTEKPLAWTSSKPVPLKSMHQIQLEIAEDETDVDHESETSRISLRAGSKNTLNGPILQGHRQFSTLSKTPIPPKSTKPLYATSTVFVPATASPSRISPIMQWRALQPPVRRSSTNIAPSSIRTNASPFKTFAGLRPSNADNSRPSIVPSTKIWKSPPPKPGSSTIHNRPYTVEQVSKSKKSQHKRHPLSTTGESTVAKKNSATNDSCNDLDSEHPSEKEVVNRSHFSDHTFSPNTLKSSSNEPERRRGSGSNSSESSNMLRWPSKDKGRKLSDEKLEYLSSMKLKQTSNGDTEDKEMEEEEQSEELWELHGIINDELRRVDGQLVHFYLCDWVGNWEPTWEPEQNLSADAVKKYEKKGKTRGKDIINLDGSVDLDMVVQNGKPPN